MEKTIIMSVQDDKLKLSVSPELDVATALQMLGTLTTHLLNAYTQSALHTINKSTALRTAKEKHAAITGIKESMYDAANTVLSNALNKFYPENPTLDLEEEAILELTNKLIEDRYNKLSPKEKAAYKRAIAASRSALTHDQRRTN